MGTLRKPYCFTDFDGTLTDNRKRLYRFYMEHAPKNGPKLLTEEDFWAGKRAGIHELEPRPGDSAAERIDASVRAEYDAEKKRVIESDAYLELDAIFPYAGEALRRIAEDHTLILLTRRSHADAFYREWERSGLGGYFDAVHVIPHSYGGKAEFIRENYSVDPARDVIVGDTEDDLKAGTELGMISYLTLSGIRDTWIIEKYFEKEKDRIRVIGDIRELEHWEAAK